MIRTFVHHLRHNVVAYLALFVALGGTAYAASLPANSVGTRQLVNGGVKADDIGKLPGVNAFTNETTQQLDDGVWSPVQLQNELFDIGGMHSSNQNTRIVAPRKGTYVVQGTAIFENACCGSRHAEISLHRAQGGATGVDRASTGSSGTLAHVGAVVRMNAGDYVELLANETSRLHLGVGGRLSAAYVGG